MKGEVLGWPTAWNLGKIIRLSAFRRSLKPDSQTRKLDTLVVWIGAKGREVPLWTIGIKKDVGRLRMLILMSVVDGHREICTHSERKCFIDMRVLSSTSFSFYQVLQHIKRYDLYWERVIPFLTLSHCPTSQFVNKCLHWQTETSVLPS